MLVALAVFTAYSASQQSEGPDYPAGSAYSSQPEGARALELWLGELGYETVKIEGGAFFPDETTRLLLILSPSYMLTAVEVSILDKWVRKGGTLVYADDESFSYELLEQFDLKLDWLGASEEVSIVQPLLNTPPVQQVETCVQVVWKPTRDDYVTHLEASGKPVLISLRHGRGWVFATTAVEPFTNAGLKGEGNAALVYNIILAGVGRAGKIAFDEYHHGFQSQPSLRTWLVNSRVGWAILYSALVVFLFLLIGGRRFGAPVPLPEHTARRTTAEYIRALANLNRRANRRQAVLAHYKDRLKRHLGRAYRIDPGLDDPSFVSELASYWPGLDQEGLSRLLADLSRRSVSQRDMVRLAEETTRFWTV